MKIGIFSLADNPYPWRTEKQFFDEFMEQSVLAERLGYHSCWIGEHHFSHYGACPSPQVFLAALAGKTEKIRLGQAVQIVPFDNPLRLAEDYALLDVLSNGRVDFGVGRGFSPHEYEKMGVPYSESRARYEEEMDIIVKAWTEDRFSYEGKHHRVDNISVIPKPLQKPHPPIYMAAVSPETLIYSARKGFSAMLAPFSLLLQGGMSGMQKKAEEYKHLAAENGHPDVEVICSYFIHVTEDGSTLREAGECMERYFHKLIPYLIPADRYIDERFEMMRERLSNVKIEELLENRSVLFGTPEECIKGLHEFEAIGVSQILAYFAFGGMSHDLVTKTMELFAEKVLPAFHKTPTEVTA